MDTGRFGHRGYFLINIVYANVVWECPYPLEYLQLFRKIYLLDRVLLFVLPFCFGLSHSSVSMECEDPKGY